MKALTIRQPWAALVISGRKKIENRSRPTSYRGRVLIHASKAPLEGPPVEGLGRLEFGCLIGSVDIVGCSPISEVAGEPFAEGPWCWILENARAFPAVPCSGKLSFWTVPEDVLNGIPRDHWEEGPWRYA